MNNSSQKKIKNNSKNNINYKKINTDINTGLNQSQINERVVAGLTNVSETKTSKSYAKILFSNIFTFNHLNNILFHNFS